MTKVHIGPWPVSKWSDLDVNAVISIFPGNDLEEELYGIGVRLTSTQSEEIVDCEGVGGPQLKYGILLGCRPQRFNEEDVRNSDYAFGLAKLLKCKSIAVYIPGTSTEGTEECYRSALTQLQTRNYGFDDVYLINNFVAGEVSPDCTSLMSTVNDAPCIRVLNESSIQMNDYLKIYYKLNDRGNAELVKVEYDQNMGLPGPLPHICLPSEVAIGGILRRVVSIAPDAFDVPVNRRGWELDIQQVNLPEFVVKYDRRRIQESYPRAVVTNE